MAFDNISYAAALHQSEEFVPFAEYFDETIRHPFWFRQASIDLTDHFVKVVKAKEAKDAATSEQRSRPPG